MEIIWAFLQEKNKMEALSFKLKDEDDSVSGWEAIQIERIENGYLLYIAQEESERRFSYQTKEELLKILKDIL